MTEKPSVNQLLRQQAAENLQTVITRSRESASRSRQDKATKPRLSSPKAKKIRPKMVNKTAQWPPLPQNRLGSLTPVKKMRQNAVNEVLKEKPTSKKFTSAHEEVIRMRDLVFEVLYI